MGNILDYHWLVDRITELEKRLSMVMIENQHMRNELDDIWDKPATRIRIPHRCPVCNGSDKETLCQPCDGNGIVWG